tara:strand:+ start:1639 stop:1929 length:291 start_codon:yes stop_codon:yes gene_type:complete
MKLEINEHEQYLICRSLTNDVARKIEHLLEIMAKGQEDQWPLKDILNSARYECDVITRMLDVADSIAPSKEWRDVVASSRGRIARLSEKILCEVGV